MPSEIVLQRIHTCDEDCEYIYMIGYRTNKKNPEYDPNTKKCSKSGKLIPTSPRYSLRTSDHERIEMCTSTLWDVDGYVQPDEVVIPDKTVNVQFDFPLTGSFLFELNGKTDDGITRRQLVELTRQTYENIYLKEEISSSEKVVPIDERGVYLNRNTTNGVYGVRWYDLEDLWLEGMYYDANKKLVTLSIGS